MTNDSTHDYNRALLEVDELARANPDPESQAGKRLLEVSEWLVAYEREHFPDMFPDQRDRVIALQQDLNLAQEEVRRLSDANRMLERERDAALQQAAENFEARNVVTRLANQRMAEKNTLEHQLAMAAGIIAHLLRVHEQRDMATSKVLARQMIEATGGMSGLPWGEEV